MLSFPPGAPITVVDGSDQPLAHGHIVDDEPLLDDMDDSHDYMQDLAIGHWKIIQLSSVVHGGGSYRFDEDWVFTINGSLLNKDERTVKHLSEIGSFLMYHQTIKPRIRDSMKDKKKKRREKADDRHAKRRR